MPTAPDTFLVTCGGIGAIGVDYVDVGVEPDEDVVYAFVHFRPRIPKGKSFGRPVSRRPEGFSSIPFGRASHPRMGNSEPSSPHR